MEVIRTFLESSTIHGLSYISTERKIVKLFWILVVILGFTGASIIIYQSFQDWHDNPITTTIQTLPLKDITLPKITVCPPKNTYTDLNYDIMMLENRTMNKEIRDMLINFSVKLIQDRHFEEVMSNLTLIEESNRYYNWYYGYTSVQIPYWGKKNTCTDCALLIYFYSSIATSGTINTKYFGEKFDVDKIRKNFLITFDLHVPQAALKNKTYKKCYIFKLGIIRVPK